MKKTTIYQEAIVLKESQKHISLKRSPNMKIEDFNFSSTYIFKEICEALWKDISHLDRCFDLFEQILNSPKEESCEQLIQKLIPSAKDHPDHYIHKKDRYVYNSRRIYKDLIPNIKTLCQLVKNIDNRKIIIRKGIKNTGNRYDELVSEIAKFTINYFLKTKAGSKTYRAGDCSFRLSNEAVEKGCKEFWETEVLKILAKIESKKDVQGHFTDKIQTERSSSPTPRSPVSKETQSKENSNLSTENQRS